MKLALPMTLILIIAPVLTVSFRADAVEIEQIETTLNTSPRRCPSNLVEVKDLTYKENCGANYMSAMSTAEVSKCQNETDHKNNLIYKYNAFIRECKQVGNRDRPSASKNTTTKINADRLKAAQQKAAGADAAKKASMDKIKADEQTEHEETLVEQRRKLDEDVRRNEENQERIRQAIPKEEHIIPTAKYPSMSWNGAHDASSKALKKGDCQSSADGYICTVPHWSGFYSYRGNCYNVREYNLYPQGNENGPAIDVICFRQ